MASQLWQNECTFDVLSAEAVAKEMENCITDLNSILQLRPSTMRFLCNYFGWDTHKLLECYYDMDPTKLFQKFGVISFNSKGHQLTSNNLDGEDEGQDCQICYICFIPNKKHDLECGHYFCPTCWVTYFTTKIMEEGTGQISCGGHDCPILVEDEMIMELVQDLKIQQRYYQLITDSFVQCNKSLRWCPSRDCTRAIRVHYKGPRPFVTCACGHKFCFECAHEWHEPLRCDLTQKWLQKCSDESETYNWIVANTKNCPECNSPIEKDGGCNHMTCKNVNCQTEFCWLCLQLWSIHINDSGYICNSFDAKEEDRENSRVILDRYVFYFDRYMNHIQSLKLEHKLHEIVETHMKELQLHRVSWIDVQYLKQAVHVLTDCRRTLMYTYAFAFYLEKNLESVIFEDNQRDLEAATETLSGYLEHFIVSQAMEDFNIKVQDKSRYCEHRRQVILKHCYEGYLNNFWVYNHPKLNSSTSKAQAQPA